MQTPNTDKNVNILITRDEVLKACFRDVRYKSK